MFYSESGHSFRLNKRGCKDPGVWKILKLHCFGVDRKIYFGQNLIPKNKSAINVGDSIEINADFH
jgi:uncharacterized protein YcbX